MADGHRTTPRGPVTPLVFTYDRPAQLELLLRSLEVNGGGLFGDPVVLARWSSLKFYRGYKLCLQDHRAVLVREEGFRGQVAQHVAKLAVAHGHFIAFCDDDVLYRDLASFTPDPATVLERDSGLVCLSLRLGLNTQVCYPLDTRAQLPPALPVADTLSWVWRGAEGDFGYPASLDGHLFYAADVRDALMGRAFHNPNTLEDALVAGLRDSPRRRMASYFVSALVGNPLNRVAETHTANRVSELPGCSKQEMLSRFMAGERLSLAAIAEAQIDGAHHEIAPVWEEREPKSAKKIAAKTGGAP